MKLTICYTVFNGLELLEQSILNHYELVDNILICYQTVSNTGNKSNEVLRFSKYLESKYSKVKSVEFIPDLSKRTKQNEIDKHNLMLDYSREIESTHYILSACDHFYNKDQFDYAKSIAIEKDFDVSLTWMNTYYKKTNWKLDPIESYCMPFISKLYPTTKYINDVKYTELVDPSVKVNTSWNMHLFNKKECMLHHYSMIREDIENKFRNAAASIRWKPEQIEKFIHEYENAKPGDEISYFKNRKIIEIDNSFNI
ncbi:MAG: hypothetical protein JKY43_10165 [Phycisphaerales bacterium]|nr:hypothetical protein [Phycisphaerales bacterium]